MAAPTKNLVDATSPTRMATMSLVYSPTEVSAITLNPKVIIVEILSMPNRFMLESINPSLQKAGMSLSPTKISLLESTLVVFKTFPAGYHESAKVRPTEGQIYPRKRNKNY